MALTTLASWFHLNEGRRSFTPDPVEDNQVVFCHQEVQESIQLAVEQAFATGDTLKLLLWGDWGVGKTHTLRHLQYWLDAHRTDFPARTIFAQVGDVSKSSRFSIVHRDLLEGVGLAAVVEMIHKLIQTGKQLGPTLDHIGVPANISQAFTKLLVATPGQPVPDIVVTAWNYLRGEEVGRDGISLGLQSSIEDSKDFYGVLQAIGYLYRTVHETQLIFLVDEAARLETVSAVPEVERHWVHVNTLIFDQQNRYFGFVYTVSGQNADSIPAALFERQIENRLLNRRIELKPLQPDSVRNFINKLRSSFVDEARVRADTSITSDGAFDWDTYPFTQPAFDHFLDHFQRNREDSKPRDICGKMDAACFRALKAKTHLVDEAALSAINL